MASMEFDAHDIDPSLYDEEDGYDARNPEALRIVAELIYEMSELEWSVNHAISKILQISEEATSDLLKYVGIGKKIDILGAVSKRVESSRLDRDLKNTIKEINAISEVRNKVAHCVFDANDTEIRIYPHGWWVDRTKPYTFDFLKEKTQRANVCAAQVREFAEALDGKTIKEIMNEVLSAVASSRRADDDASADA